MATKTHPIADDLAAVRDFPRRVAAILAELAEMETTAIRLAENTDSDRASRVLTAFQNCVSPEPGELPELAEICRAFELFSDAPPIAFDWWYERCHIRQPMTNLREDYSGSSRDDLEAFNDLFGVVEPDLALWLDIFCDVKGEARMRRSAADLERLGEIERAIVRVTE